MRSSFMIAAILILIGATADAQPFTQADRAEVRKLPQRYTRGWLNNSRSQVMSLFAPDAVFIPHDGVRPHRGKQAIDQFWFPNGRTAGIVTSFTMTVEGASGASDHAIVWGRSDLHWQDKTTAYHWPGYYLMAAERRHGAWLVTHLMSSDEQPTSKPVKASR
jgi:uncharacterized protein (TIGR02246 family)